MEGRRRRGGEGRGRRRGYEGVGGEEERRGVERGEKEEIGEKGGKRTERRGKMRRRDIRLDNVIKRIRICCE